MKEKLAKIVSIITVVPIVALVFNISLYIAIPASFEYNFIFLFAIVVCLCIVPILAYPIARILPGFKGKGREGERKLAFILALIGYLLGMILVLLGNLPNIVNIIFTAYFISGVSLAFINKVIKVKASGHACGVTSPIILLIYFLGVPAVPVLILFPLVFWARLIMGRHTLKELIIGTIVGFLSSVLAIIILTL